MKASGAMNWQQLLNKSRLGNRPAKDEKGRNAFLRDHDKIIFSGAFRRLEQLLPSAGGRGRPARLTR